MHKKETDRNTLLTFDSCHPRKMSKSLPYSQMLRVRRIVTNEEDLEGTLEQMVTGFRERGYPHYLAEEHKQKV